MFRFFREAAALRAVQHRNIAAFYDIGQQDLKYYLVMEFVDGPNLEHWLKDRPALPEPAAFDLVLQLARALDALHRLGMVHRDVKPSNVLVAPDGTLKLVDFGLARGAQDTLVTDTHAFMGTAGYIAPEVVAGAKELDIR